uniref:(northern house mosquito) hypothetical protein n=1 Tax=Culex pipiens TaxID=7175 RepID=A0A8D8MW68_CULPI
MSVQDQNWIMASGQDPPMGGGMRNLLYSVLVTSECTPTCLVQPGGGQLTSLGTTRLCTSGRMVANIGDNFAVCRHPEGQARADARGRCLEVYYLEADPLDGQLN